MSFQKLTRTVTAVVSERSSPFPPVSPWPLIYVLDVMNPNDDQEILRHVADIRYIELACEDEDGSQSDQVYEIMNGLELHFVFQGDVTADVVDFRESA